MVSFFSFVLVATALTITNGMHLRADDGIENVHAVAHHRELQGGKKKPAAAAAPAAAPPAKKRHGEPMVLAMTVQPGNKLKLHGLWPTTICSGTPANDMAGFVASAWSSTGKSAKDLAIHEYKKHGFCNYVGPSAYYSEAQALGSAAASKLPTSFACPTGDLHIKDGTVNKKVKFTCKGKNLNEIRYCYNKGANWVTC
ncbi:Aste57867_19809 [Aphanomyces stellatus]|uniref:Aste57867_19809 protein n=1 Tax=Aphanomyces stellatus TaxID=120398 RepID=A0A485LE48_9STRA|nr:hypothetical protein As57867_019744 [Aphanomyces stellatus]VFT96507.1 Aste57867_19809 [Aphanomyces stellatus]